MRRVCLIIFSPGFRRVWKLRLNAHLLFSLLSLCAIAGIAMGGMSYVSFMKIGDSELLYHLVAENGDLVKEKQSMESQVDQLRARASVLAKEAARIAAELQKEGVPVARSQ